jgi:hypothetical protein
MKAKSNFSTLVAETTARGSLAVFAGITIFLSGFVTWSAGSAVVSLISLF